MPNELKQSGSPAAHALIFDKAKIIGELGPCVLWCEINGKKVPVNRAGFPVNPLDPKNHMPFDMAAHLAAASGFTGVGLVLTGLPRDDGLVLTALDYDAKGNMGPEERARRQGVAAEHIERFGSYAETSVSGLGQHIFIFGRPIGRNLKLGAHNEIEVFQQNRFIAITGQLLGSVGEVRANPDELERIIAAFSAPQGRAPLRIVGGLEFDPAVAPPAERFRGLPVENELGWGIETNGDPPQREEIARICAAIGNSPEALKKTGCI